MKNTFIALLALFSLGALAQAAGEKPNIIIILNDDMGYADLSCFGAKNYKTPRIDQMAEEGRKFTSFYVASPVCSASRASLLTGRYPENVGVNGVFFPNRVTRDGSKGLSPDHFTIAELLQGAGYSTFACGKWHLGDEPKYLPRNQGFDSYYGVPYSNDMYPSKSMKYAEDCFYREGVTPEKIALAFTKLMKNKQPDMRDKVPLMRDEECIEFPLDQTTITRRLADESIRFIAENAKAKKPFFLYLANPMPHVPLFVSPEFDGKTGQGLYADVIAEIDHNTGRVMDALKKHGVDKNTLVIFTSDNGPWLSKADHGGKADPLRDGKGSSYEGGQRVATIMRWPARIPAGSECKEMASTMDFMPTFAKIAKAELPKDLKTDGYDISELITGDATVKTPYEIFYYGKSAVRKGDWKYRQGHEFGHWSMPVRPKHNPKVVQVFNLSEDVAESKNQANDYPEIRVELKKLLDERKFDSNK